MASIQCKMCGGQVALPDGVTAGECPYCGSLTTFPKISDEQTEQLYLRAEHFRQKNDFDKAVSVYESILARNPEDPEAYWGLLISKYGIEYVEDPATHERIPTCHRVQFDSILADSDYRNALRFSSGYDRDIYEKEARRIAEIQKAILKISSQEKPYDVFICYKETTDGGTRTKDSTLAQDIYYQLTNQGLKVFFARITLEDKLGQQYEPYIFAALNSSKVMLVIGSKREYFEAVWVKNEWSRFLAIMKKDRSKLLIPCYKDMDAYDIPEELSMFQSQDMGKIGFIQDILRGIMKVVNAGKVETPAPGPASGDTRGGSSGPSISNILKRISVLLQQRDWEKVKSCCERGFDIDPENSMLYFMLCLGNRQVSNEMELMNSACNLAVDKNFQISIQYATPERKEQLLKIQARALDNFISACLQRCMATYRIPREADLYRCPRPLAQDPNYQMALKLATPERRKTIVELRFKQSNFYLEKCRERYQFSENDELRKCRVPLGSDPFFQIARASASQDQARYLACLITEQQGYKKQKELLKSIITISIFVIGFIGFLVALSSC